MWWTTITTGQGISPAVAGHYPDTLAIGGRLIHLPKSVLNGSSLSISNPLREKVESMGLSSRNRKIAPACAERAGAIKRAKK